MVRPLTMCLLWLTSAAAVADYPQFRGPTGNGRVESAEPPLSWSETKNLAWKTDLPGTGWSQPVVFGRSVYITAAVSDKLPRPKDMAAGAKALASIPVPGFGPKPLDATIQWQLLALDTESGEIRWAKTIVEDRPKHSIHPSNTYATETPCADADRVYVYFGATGTLAALTHDGNEVWRTELGAYPISNGFGSGSSPALFDGKLFVASFNEEKSFLVAIHAADGKELWRHEPEIKGSAWATPFVWRNKQRTEIIACGNKLATSHEPETGNEFWRLGKIDTAFAPSPSATEDLLLLAASSPFSASPLYAVKAGADGDISLARNESSNSGIAWFRNRSGVGMSSPVASGKHLYIPGNSILSCVDIATGAEQYKQRLPKSRMIAASSVTLGDKLLILDESGQATWVKTGPEFAVLGEGRLPDTFWSSPAISGKRIYLRGVAKLYCVSTE